MSKIIVNKVNVETNEVDSTDYWVFTYDAEKKKIKKKLSFIGVGNTQSRWSLYAATTEQECIDEINRLNLT